MAIEINPTYAISLKDYSYPMYEGHFEPSGDFIEDYNGPVGGELTGDPYSQRLGFLLNFKFDAFPEKTTTDLNVVYDINIAEIDNFHYEQTASEWEDAVLIYKEYTTPPSEDFFGDHPMQISLEFEDTGCVSAGLHSISTTLKVFFNFSTCSE